MSRRAAIIRAGKRRDREAGRATKRGPIRVGTASWSDPGFVEDWYPPDLPARERLLWYAEHFNLVEVNSSFYALPGEKVVERWVEQTPDDFAFDVKLHRLLSRHSTPVKYLPAGLKSIAVVKGTKVELTPKLETAFTKEFLKNIDPLRSAGKLGALLLQLSPAFGPRDYFLTELDRLIGLLEGYPLAVELRNRNWLDEGRRAETTDYFKKCRVTLVGVDGPPSDHFTVMPAFDVVTNSKLAYLRAHGRNVHGYISGRTVPDRFDYDYSTRELKEIAGRAEKLAEAAGSTHIIFNNNKSDYAPRAAARFRKIVEPAGAKIST
jgi:uncharacterized protein YecE (DUF72 family)